MIILLIFFSLSGLIISSTLSRDRTQAQTIHNTKVRSERYYEAEQSVARAVSWLRQQSQMVVTPFRRDEFYTHFERTDPLVGDNDTSPSPFPTKIKLRGTNDSAILVTDTSLGTSDFAPSRDITSGSNFDVVNEFLAANLGSSKVKITLIDAIADDAASDFGDPALGNPLPATDFYPIYRIETLSGQRDNTHVYTTVVGDVVHVFDLGIYGQDYLEINQPCDSYLSSVGSYSAGTKRAKCPAGSNSTSSIHKNNEIYGSLQTNGDVDSDPPFGGDTCADFDPGCPNKGETCAGEDCGVPLLEIFDTWASYCPSDKGDVVYNVDDTLDIIDSDLSDPDILPIDRCWNQVTVGTGTVLTLDATNAPYYIKTLILQNNSNSVLDVQPNPANGTVELWVEEIVGDGFNGNQVVNSNHPTSFFIYYLGSNPLTLNGNADMNSALVAPNAAVSVLGNFDYHGALLAKELTLSGSGLIHYDESLGGGGKISDVQYKLEELVQRYR